MCPDGRPGVVDCSESNEDLGGIEFCKSDNGFVALSRYCPIGTASAMGTVLVGVRSKEFAGDCDDYGLRIFATYGPSEPSEPPF